MTTGIVYDDIYLEHNIADICFINLSEIIRYLSENGIRF